MDLEVLRFVFSPFTALMGGFGAIWILGRS